MRYLKSLAAVCVLAIAGAATVSAQQSLRTVLPKSQVMSMIVEEAIRQDVAPELALAVARVESNFRTHAVSHKGARGVMQIMPKTARDEFDVPAHRLFDARTNIRLGVKFLKQLHAMYGGSTEYALSHYNGGSRVRRKDGTLRVIPATRPYVNKVLAQQAHYRNHHLVLAALAPAIPRRPQAVSTLDDFSNPYSRLNRTMREPYGRGYEPVSLARLNSERAQLVRKLRTLKNKNSARFIETSRVNIADESVYRDFEYDNWRARREKVRQWEAY